MLPCCGVVEDSRRIKTCSSMILIAQQQRVVLMPPMLIARSRVSRGHGAARSHRRSRSGTRLSCADLTWRSLPSTPCPGGWRSSSIRRKDLLGRRIAVNPDRLLARLGRIDALRPRRTVAAGTPRQALDQPADRTARTDGWLGSRGAGRHRSLLSDDIEHVDHAHR